MSEPGHPLPPGAGVVATSAAEAGAKPGPVIAVFDSGFGGLTVLRALLPLIPGARYLYLGDTARLPYGEKSQATIVRYALSSAAFLLAQGAEMLVVACNTASALALDELRAALPIPVVGVIEPGVAAAARALTELRAESASPNNRPTAPSADAEVLVLATAATVHSHAYARACRALDLAAYEKACPLLVPLVEEGWTAEVLQSSGAEAHGLAASNPAKATVTAEVLRIYLAEALAEAPSVSTLVLGCTHYPLLRPLIEQTLRNLGHPLTIVDSASAAAHAAAVLVPATQPPGTPPACTFYATDSIQKFQRLGSSFLGQPLSEVHLVDLGG